MKMKFNFFNINQQLANVLSFSYFRLKTSALIQLYSLSSTLSLGLSVQKLRIFHLLLLLSFNIFSWQQNTIIINSLVLPPNVFTAIKHLGSLLFLQMSCHLVSRQFTLTFPNLFSTFSSFSSTFCISSLLSHLL